MALECCGIRLRQTLCNETLVNLRICMFCCRMARNVEQSKKGMSRKEPSPDLTSRKRNLTLDLQFQSTAKRAKYDLSKDTAPVLSSPDIKKLKLKSPELESIILQQNALGNGATPTPSAILFPKLVTEAQESYAKGFVDALNELHCSDSSQGGNFTGDLNSNSSSSMTYTDLDPTSRPPTFMSSLGLVIKDEPQTVPSMDSPNLSPIDMESQEVIKLERKRQRNRVAASRCRRRKLEKISRLEEKVKALKTENNELHMFMMKLKDQVCLLKGQVLEHVNSGCQMVNYC